MKVHKLKEKETALLFSAHGLPQRYVDYGDIYEKECIASFDAIKAAFPKAYSLLCYQSKFGKGLWLKPYTQEVCDTLPKEVADKKAVIMVPLSFTSDHIETLYEMEAQYIPPIRSQGKLALRCEALGQDTAWVTSLATLIKQAEPYLLPNAMLLRHEFKKTLRYAEKY